MTGKTYFVSGIDTGIGKTVAVGLMARSLRAHGVDAITVKMVQTGNDGFSEDLEKHRAICGTGRLPEDEAGLTAPQIFRFPSSPLLAARLEKRKVDLGRIAECVDACAARRQVVLVESAGGLCVPLTEDTLSVDFAAAREWPLILVTCGRLGSINHTILSLEAAKSRGMNVAGVVFNMFPDADPQICDDSVETVRSALPRLGFPPVVVKVPSVSDGGPYPDVDFGPIFGGDIPQPVLYCRP